MAANYGYMNIWHTTPPTNQDFPIWAYVGNSPGDVVLLRSKLDVPGYEPVTWCKADIPQPPKSHIREKYEVLSENSIDQAWSSYEWFKAGYEYGIERSKGTMVPCKSQDKKSAPVKPAQSPFVSPEEYCIEHSNGTMVPCKSQDKKSALVKPAQSPFVSPEEYWDEPYESAFDERL